MKKNNWGLFAAVDAVKGNPGDKRILKLERDGKTFAVEARVERIL